MRSRLIVWGVNAADQRVLLAIALNADENKVDIWSIPEKSITEEYFNELMTKWREGHELAMPEETTHEITELTHAEGILPEHIKVEKSDVIQRAQMEWHFVVLSTKLFKNFKIELEELSDKIKRLENFDAKLWDDLKSLWENVQKHIFDKNLSKDHADSLRQRANALFDELKKLRAAYAEEMNVKSKEVFQQIHDKVSAIVDKINSGAVLKPLFDDLKMLQENFKQISMTRSDREKIMNAINEAFKLIREKRQKRDAEVSSAGNTYQRLTKRYEGLMSALQKMESSIAFEKRNIEFENKRIENSTGQLEAQIRQAKILMIEERIRSKNEKLQELLKTKVKLEKTIENLKKREEKLQAKRARQELLKLEEEKIKAEISDNIHHKQENLSAEEMEKLAKAAEEIIASRSKKPRKSKKAQNLISEQESAESISENLEKITAPNEPKQEQDLASLNGGVSKEDDIARTNHNSEVSTNQT